MTKSIFLTYVLNLVLSGAALYLGYRVVKSLYKKIKRKARKVLNILFLTCVWVLGVVSCFYILEDAVGFFKNMFNEENTVLKIIGIVYIVSTLTYFIQKYTEGKVRLQLQEMIRLN